VSLLIDTRPLDVLADFPAIPAGWAYLDTAATAQKPRPVIEAIARVYGETYATVHRGVYQRSADMTLAYEAARERVATFIGAGSSAEIVYVRGATEAINLVATCWARHAAQGRRPHPAEPAGASFQYRAVADGGRARRLRDRRRAADGRSAHRSGCGGGDADPAAQAGRASACVERAGLGPRREARGRARA
jgi:hypothetical protein